MSAVLGIDGGGTRTRASIVDGAEVLAFAENGSIKRLRVGTKIAEANLRATLEDVFSKAGVKSVKAASAGVGSIQQMNSCGNSQNATTENRQKNRFQKMKYLKS